MSPLKQQHGPEHVYWDNIGEGWRFDCICGWTTPVRVCLEDAGAEMDYHFEDEKESIT